MSDLFFPERLQLSLWYEVFLKDKGEEEDEADKASSSAEPTTTNISLEKGSSVILQHIDVSVLPLYN